MKRSGVTRSLHAVWLSDSRVECRPATAAANVKGTNFPDQEVERLKRLLHSTSATRCPGMVKPRAGRGDGPKPLTLEQVRALPIAALAHALRGRNPDLSPEWAADALARKRRNVVPTQDLRAAVRALESLGSEGRNAKAPPSHSRRGFWFSELRGQDLNLRPSGYELEVADRADGRRT